MSYYVVMDGRAKTDRDAATVLESLEAGSDKEAEEQYDETWFGTDSVLLKLSETSPAVLENATEIAQK